MTIANIQETGAVSTIISRKMIAALPAAGVDLPQLERSR